jgi:hypothetical protein
MVVITLFTNITAAEMKYMRTERYTWIAYKTNTEIANELHITPVFDKIQDYKRKWIQCVNRTPRNVLPRLIKKLHPKRYKEPRKTTEVTSGCVSPERVNKWPNLLIAEWWWWWWLFPDIAQGNRTVLRMDQRLLKHNLNLCTAAYSEALSK